MAKALASRGVGGRAPGPSLHRRLQCAERSRPRPGSDTAPPLTYAKTQGYLDRNGLCHTTLGDASCKPATVDGHQVFLDQRADGGFVVDYVQPDGELASAWVGPLFGDEAPLPPRKMDISLTTVMALLTDPDLDIVG